ncbi:cell division protein Fic [Bacilli bacterium]|nr:cell division protein Fic [Bacilli bacterium]
MINTKNIKITPQMLSAIGELDEFKGAWTGFARLRPEQLKALKKVSTIESIGSSNRIEGNRLSDDKIEALLSSVNGTSFKSRDEEEVVGYAKLMDTIFENYENIILSENYIKQLHQILLQYVSKDEKHRGEYKKISNSVVAFDSSGKKIGIVFETASPFDTPRLMEELVGCTRKNLNDKFFHPLIVIGIFIVHFLSIHPFQDGNGRLSRALSSMLLLKKGYTYIPYSSMESIIEASKEGYYRALRQSQKNIWTDSVDYEPWLSFFLSTLQKQKKHLEEKIKKIITTKPDYTKLSRLAVQILGLFDRKPQWTVLEIAKELNSNFETLRASVKSLAKGGYIVKHGTTRGAWYERN